MTSRNRALLGAATLALGLSASAQSFVVPNGSFELPIAPSIPGATPVIDVWVQSPRPPFIPIDDTAWDQSSGIFLNAPVGNPRHINNADGNQVAFFFPLPGLEITQQLGDTFTIGSSYNLTVGLRGSADLTVGNTFDIGLFYMDGATRVNLATGTATSTSAYQTSTELFDITATLPAVLAGDDWAGQTIGIYLSAMSFNGNANLAYWEVDNVRLAATAVPEPRDYAMIAGAGLVAAAIWRRRNLGR
jgi:hypothetical protein